MYKRFPYFSVPDRFFKIVAFAIMLVGIVVRTAVFLQNRNLYIDEANIARNIYERSFLQLALPLSYEQYAPPVFLWMLKLFTEIFGYGEAAFRMYPLLAGTASIILLYLILKEITSLRSLWYPLGLFVVSYMSIRYASELKQYMSDVMIVLALILLALKTDVLKMRHGKFILIWLAAGTLAIWSAMPSVFVLTGVGFYYFRQLIAHKQSGKLWVIIVTGLLWLVQFAIYYLLILKTQIESSYLQNFHQEYFLFATPENKEEWLHNWNVIKNLIQEAGGFWQYALYFNTGLLLTGGIAFIIREPAKALLILVPLAAVITAAALNQYSLIPRVAFFMTPLFLLLIGYGLHWLISLKSAPLSLVLYAFGSYCIYSLNMIKLAWQPLETEQITDAMSFVMSRDINQGDRLFVHNGAGPAFIYYTQIHPEQSKWNRINNAHLLLWDADFDALARNSEGRTAYIFTSVDINKLSAKKSIIEKYCTETAKLEKQGCYAYVFDRKNTADE